MKLQPGDPAPDFTLRDQDGKSFNLAQLKGKKVVLYFYPKDATPGCTAEACNLRDNHEVLQREGYEVVGISTDSSASHKKFIAKENLPFTLISDPEKIAHELYGTWVEKSMYGRKYMGTARVTFLIDENMIISRIIEKVNTKQHSAQILAEVPEAEEPESSEPPVKAKVAKTAAKKTGRNASRGVSRKPGRK